MLTVNLQSTCSSESIIDNRPMKRRCENCEEELIGSVNRCWKCGTAVDVESLLDTPPIRRAPVDLNGETSAASLGLDTITQSLPYPLSVDLSERGRHNCAIASVVCGVLACLTGIMSAWTILLGLIGIALGVMGMQSKHRDLATMGLVLSVLAIFLGFWQIGFDLWTKYQSRQWLDELQGIE